MPKEIKLKFWSTNRKKFVNPAVWCYDGGKLFAQLRDEEEDVLDTIIPLQYTGVKDIDNNDVYEGDVVETIYNNGEKGKIVYCDSLAAFRINTDGKLNIPLITFTTKEEAVINGKIVSGELKKTFTKVIGNIFENPELIK